MRIETPGANLSQFAAQRARAVAKYVSFVQEGARLPSVWSRLQGQVYPGAEKFVEGMPTLVDKKASLAEIPRAQRRALKRALSDYARAHAMKPLRLHICRDNIRWRQLQRISVCTTPR